MAKKVMVSGCYDLLHSGHIAFFNQAATYGDLYVAIGSDKTVFELKGQSPINTQDERLYMIKAVGCVKDAFISKGSGMLDFKQELIDLKPDYFIVNTDGNTLEKEALCKENRVNYVILEREPYGDLTPRSSTALREINTMPFRIDLAGGWLDQPYVSKYYPGSVITISIEPTIQFNDRSGMASSTRRSAIDLWGPRLPIGPTEKLAKILFCYDNPPGTEEISGSQDSIGIVFPGLAYSFYDGKYWPIKINRITSETHLQFIENSLYLITLGPRESDYSVLDNTRIDKKGAKALALAAELCWEAIFEMDIVKFGKAVRNSFEAQISMFPNMMNKNVSNLIQKYQHQALGWKLSGAGGGGYLILVSQRPIKNALKIVARRAEH